MCPGKLYVPKGIWVLPAGKTSGECTYCEWCIRNKCVVLDEGQHAIVNDMGPCSCDCPLREQHATLKPYDCGKHQASLLGDCMMGTCEACHRPATTSSGRIKYCPGCSAFYQMCNICGITEQGEYPFRRRCVAKMLSVQNGRRGINDDKDSDDDSS